MITFTCIDPPSIYSSEWRYLHLFLIELRPVVLQPPRFHVFGEVLHHAGDDITVPRPGVLAVILTGSRRMIRVGVVPADHLQAALTRRLLSRAKIFRRRSEEHKSELQSPCNLVCRLLLEKKKKVARKHRLAILCDKTSIC